MRRRSFLQQVVGGVTAGLCAGGAEGADVRSTARRPNVVYLLADQWRAQATGYAGDPNVKTPHLDKLAGQSVWFQHAVSACPVCTPYRAALMTGRYPMTTGMFLNDLYLPERESCMAELFRAGGYTTGYIGKWHLDGHGRSAYIPPERRQGFEYWKAAECDHHYPHSHYYTGTSPEKRYWSGYDAYAQTADAQRYIHEHAKDARPFLLVVSYGPPHFPWNTAPDDMKALYPPESIQLPPNVPEAMQPRARRAAQGYYGHCTALDRCVGEVLATLDEAGIGEDTILVFTSDHGEMMGAHGVRPGEKQRPWDESIRVPFLLRYPGAHGGAGRVVRTPLNTPDILPTLLALAGLEASARVEGEDLSGLVDGDGSERDRAALIMSVSPFAGYLGGREFRGVRTTRYTYVRDLNGPWLVYDNEADPWQMENLVDAPEHAALRARLDARLERQLAAREDAFLSAAATRRKWGYTVNRQGAISYASDAPVQSPGRSS